MASYTQDEIFSATEIVRKFGPILKSIMAKERKRAVIVKNNKMEAVLLPMSEYEKLKDAYEVLKTLYERKKDASRG